MRGVVGGGAGPAQALFFPSIHLLYGDVQDPRVAAETCRAYNNWMSDFCKVEPGRQFGVGLVPLQDVSLVDDLGVAIHGSFDSKMKSFSSERYLGLP